MICKICQALKIVYKGSLMRLMTWKNYQIRIGVIFVTLVIIIYNSYNYDNNCDGSNDDGI